MISQERHKREDLLVNMFIDTAMSPQLCDSPAFRGFTVSLEPKFKTPGAARINNLIGAKIENEKEITKNKSKLKIKNYYNLAGNKHFTTEFLAFIIF